MPTRKEMLDKYTLKDDVDDLEHRIYYILRNDKGETKVVTPKTGEELSEDIKEHRVAKIITLLVIKLQERGLLNEDEIDDLLLEVAV